MTLSAHDTDLISRIFNVNELLVSARILVDFVQSVGKNLADGGDKLPPCALFMELVPLMIAMNFGHALLKVAGTHLISVTNIIATCSRTLPG